MAAFTYTYTGNLNIHKVSAEVAGKVCEQLQNSSEGLSPQTLLDYSRDESSPTHREFEWEDHIAAEKYRLDQAANLIRDIRIVTIEEQTGDVPEDMPEEDAEGKPKEAKADRAFVVTPGRKSNYVSLERALNNDEWRESLLRQAKNDSRIFLAKYRRLEELAEVAKAMTDFIERAG